MQQYIANNSLDDKRLCADNERVPAPSLEDSYRRRHVVLGVLCLSLLLVVASNMALNVALPVLGRDLHAGSTALAWVVDVYVLAFAGLLLPAGALGDRFGRKGVLQCGLTVFVIAATLAAFTTAPWQLALARAVMGAGAALVMPGTLSILATVFPPAERPSAIAVWASVAGASVAVSITGSGLVLEHFWWGAVFIGMAAIGAAALLAGRWLLPTSRHAAEARFDHMGAVLSLLGVTGVLYGLIEGPDLGWSAPEIVGAFVIGLLAVTSFVTWERRRSHPMLDVTFFADRRFMAGSLSIAVAYFALFGMYFLMTQYLQLVRGYSPLRAGVCALPAGIMQLAAANRSRSAVARYGMRRVLVAGLLASAGGLGLLATSGTASAIAVFEIGLGLLGVGIGMTMPPATGAIMRSLPQHMAGVGSAVNDLTREVGGAFGIGLLGSIALSRYRAILGPVLSGMPTSTRDSAAGGLAQVLGTPGSTQRAIGEAAQKAYTSGLELAMVVGAAFIVLAAASVGLGLRARSTSSG